jgi:hypothetical protein
MQAPHVAVYTKPPARNDRALSASINPVRESGQDTQGRNAQQQDSVIQNSRALELLRGCRPEAHHTLRQERNVQGHK